MNGILNENRTLYFSTKQEEKWNEKVNFGNFREKRDS